MLTDMIPRTKALQEETVPQTEKYIGKPLRKKEALPLLIGKGTYTDDVELPGKMHHVTFLRSPYAHARIRSIDTSMAMALEGVTAVFTGENLRDIDLKYWADLPELRRPNRHPLALDKVKFQGEPVAVVAAEDRYTAEDALELIEVDYEPLPPITDPLKALDDKRNRVYEEFPDNVLSEEAYETSDNVLSKIDECPVIIEEEFKNGRTSPIPLEPRIHLAHFNGERLSIWASTQIPHMLRTYISETLGLSETKVRVIAPNVGGGFGPKCNIFPDEVALYAIALRLGVPVKWVETRTEHFLMAGHERDQIHKVRAGFTNEGRIVAVHDVVVADVGIGGVFWTELLQLARSTTCLPGPYRFKHYRFHVRGVATNKAPWSANVGFGRPPGTFVIERIMEIAANKLGIDPAEIRRINLVGRDEFPYRNPAGVTYDSGDYRNALEKLLRSMSYEDLRLEQAKLRNRDRFIGIGLSIYVETSASSMKWFQSRGFELAGQERVTVKVLPTGKIIVAVGAADQGQGQKTIFAQIAADELSANIDDIEVVQGDTDQTLYAAGTFNSRSTVTTGNAIVLASRKLVDKIKRIAAHLLDSKPEQIFIRNGVAQVLHSDTEDTKLSLSEIAKIAYRFTWRLPSGELPYLEEVGMYDSPLDMNFMSFGCHGAVVEVDPQTGQIKVKKYFVVDDAGVIINPITADGQIEGGVICQGFLQTFNELRYDGNGNLLSSSLSDYSPPTSLEIPEQFVMNRTVTPSPSPLGAKGLGEGSAQGCPAALVNAISDALRPFGVQMNKMPVLWNEVWDKIKGSGSTTKGSYLHSV